MNPTHLGRGLAGVLLGAVAVAQSFDYPTFASTAGLTLNGSATGTGTAVRLINAAGQRGSCWRTVPTKVAEGFDTTFQFQMSAAPEGLAFVIHGGLGGATTLGGGAWGIGYGYGLETTPITNCLAIEMDAVQDGWLDDTSANELSVHTVGVYGNSEIESVSIARITPAVDMSNSTPRSMRVRFVPGVSGQLGTLTIYLVDLNTPLLTIPFSFEAGGVQLTGGSTGGLGLLNGEAWVGFTSSLRTGAATQSAEIRSWSWASLQVPPDCYEGNIGAGSGGPYDVLTVNGGIGGFFRTAQLLVGDPFTVAVAPPPGVASAPYLLVAGLGIADASTVTTTTWGSACFPLQLPIDLGSPIAPHMLTVPAGYGLNMPLTIQALMAPDPGNPGLIGLTNAIAIQFSLAPAPSITNLTPLSAPVGGTITVTGTNFSQYATLTVGGAVVAPIVKTATQLTFAMPAGVPCGSTFQVTNPDGATAVRAFNPVPTITNTLVNSGPATGGTTMIVLGTGFAPGMTVTVNGLPATVTATNATVVTFVTPPNPSGVRPVVLTTPGGCTVNTTFTYL
ncbi:MAG: IPT/TIG domain-containing protein [Planctomycetes bacterium]|nr:IPT/TIG domain-containing protein [Planctomycetota bacterium]